MLRVSAIGNLGGDAEVKRTSKDTPIASFRMAVNQIRINGSGEQEVTTEWFRVSVAGRQVDRTSRLQKGQRVFVTGRLQISHFERRDGTSGIGFEVWADEVQSFNAPTSMSVGEHSEPAVTNTQPDGDLPF